MLIRVSLPTNFLFYLPDSLRCQGFLGKSTEPFLFWNDRMTQQKSYLQWYLWEILTNSYFGNNGEEGLITELGERNYFLMHRENAVPFLPDNSYYMVYQLKATQHSTLQVEIGPCIEKLLFGENPFKAFSKFFLSRQSPHYIH